MYIVMHIIIDMQNIIVVNTCNIDLLNQFFFCSNIHAAATLAGQDSMMLFRTNYKRICEHLDESSSTMLTSFTAALFAGELIDSATKNSVIRKEGYQGAMELLDCLMIRIENSPFCFQAVLDIMEKNTLLEDIAKEIKSAHGPHAGSQ